MLPAGCGGILDLHLILNFPYYAITIYNIILFIMYIHRSDSEKYIDFDKMTETGAVSITNVRRHDFEKEGQLVYT